ncbi:DNA polymerase III, subunits gamma and tau [Beutenbergia cavernae DSM 12333]|uniref:DNA polymerase III subunit gamma/tau n=1 Tax=Beutenbergia cavernae (strain ATCC BAA-8 / DSM 12333 / CCUG 43141 / JCM 11478 / NBRC 16432 / NCIMB 13614 / HKI 0122) TaxID=471853 RepID=C5BXR7_BEUC1|nr:DNA polymerase III subunit gamma and tau [Beutenbergia cavernae]ACQ78811.1 DNA polymerase III, subunits gamma and tau [Beutenbergia cavernae DSM 12333]
MTTALYRRYRPDTFADVIGQEHVTGPLMAALRSDRATHAYLFSGPRGCGKTTSARILARCLNCAQGPTDTPCGTCDSCVELARGGPGSLDVVEIDAASHNGVDDARDLRERAVFAPARDRYKIFILDEAHMVTAQGFNALLKLVEEPPPHVKFVFATTEPDRVIGTIRSRTHHYPFRLVPPQVLGDYLAQVSEAEGVAVAPGVLPLVVRAGGGSVRDSMSVLDQLMAGADSDGLDYDRAIALLGFTHATLLDDVVDAFAAGDGATVFRVIDNVIESGHDPRRFVEDLLERLRDLIVLAAAGDQAVAVLRAIPEDQVERMRGQAQHLGAARLSRAADLVNAGLTEMTGATSPRLQLELLCARILLPATPAAATGVEPRSAGTSGPASGSAPSGGAGSAAGAAPSRRETPAQPVPRTERPPAPERGAPSRAAAEPPAASAARGERERGSAARAADEAGPESAGSVASGSAEAEPGAARRGAPATDAPARRQQPDARPGGGDDVEGRGAGAGPEAEEAPGSAEPPRSEVSDEEAPRSGEPAAGQSRSEVSDEEAPRSEVPAEGPPHPQEAAAGRTPSEAPAAGPVSAAPQPDPSPLTGTDAATVRRRWPEVLETLSGIRRVTWTLVAQNAQVASISAGVLELAFATEGLAVTFRNGTHAEALERALHETLGLDVRVRATIGDAAPTSPPAGGTSGGAGAPDAPGSAGAGDPAARAAADWAAPVARLDPPEPPAGGSAPAPADPGSTPAPGAASQARASGTSDARPTQARAPRTTDARPTQARTTAEAPPAVVGPDDPWPSDEDDDPGEPGAGSGLVGAPLVARLLGGTVIDEVADGPGGPRPGP